MLQGLTKISMATKLNKLQFAEKYLKLYNLWNFFHNKYLGMKLQRQKRRDERSSWSNSF